MATGYRHWTNSDLSANNTLKDSRGSPQLYEKTNIINTIIKKKQNKTKINNLQLKPAKLR